MRVQVGITTEWRSVIYYVIPSIIYVVHNNVQFETLKYVDAATYQILGNLKIVSTGLLLRFLLGRRLSMLQWTAILLLTTGATTSQVRAPQVPAAVKVCLCRIYDWSLPAQCSLRWHTCLQRSGHTCQQMLR